MKVATQKLTAPTLLPSSMQNLPNNLSVVDVSKICQLIVQQLATLLPTRAVWTLYQNLDTGKREFVAHSAAINNSSLTSSQSQIITYLQQEKWLLNDLSFLKVTQLNLVNEYQVYVCCVGEEKAIASEYILICTDELLTTQQQQGFLGNAQILSQYLAMSKERSHHLDQINTLSQACGKIEHQLRNPLALINLYAENLRLALPDNALQAQALVIRQTVDELSAKLTDLLYYGQKAKLHIQLHNLQTIIAECIKSLEPSLKEKNITISHPAKALKVKVDSWQMKQVFDNLLGNAIHFSPPGGTVTCDWRIYRNEVLIEICDRGSGISETDLKQIFKPYYSRRVGGTGLGLAIAQKIILDHKGNLWAENLPEGGAQFSFTLPR
ncbi:HAMP domain-containing sensor histidine kinase [Anabaena sp. UHCC 0399]|uniref:sensor histidine kinase n=1 Tax=Anabaena sp. UHCC 0399 TaxID=3110238 RepID=UPI002B210FCD|nr:HAMP domain-containing sensor histidine kinase [Anabaena sp. UHCC 0399]MEA5566820.1 HAMP domain-containing sensor histidine kinase [Anabaena sp. UHCC 0399]